MAIVELEKLTVYGASWQRPAVLEGLQRLGCMHLISLQEGDFQPPQLVAKEAREALKYLESCPDQRLPAASSAKFDLDEVVRETLEIRERRDELNIERDQLLSAIEKLEPWGDFSLPEKRENGAQEFWFYVIPRHLVDELPDDLIWSQVAEDNRSAYVVVLAAEPPADLQFRPVELDRRPLSVLRSRLEGVEEELEETHWRRTALTRWRDILQADLDEADDKAAQSAAAAGILDDQQVFALQGWVPEQAIEDVRRFADEHQLAITIDPVTPEETPPTLLKNPERVAGAEGCVTFYITPGYHSWDPTTIVYFSFSLFFAMIIADAGYGLIMAGILLFAWRKMGDSESGRRMRNLLAGIVSFTVIYGVLVGSYCGVEPPPGTILDAVRIRIDGKPMMSNQTAMMAIAVTIGVLHLTMANVISAWRARKSLRCLGHLGWALIIVGGFLAGAGAMGGIEPLSRIGLPMVITGALGGLFFSSDRREEGWSVMGLLRRLLDGVMQFANLSKAFGDSLSYLRLFALGLASAQLAVTFNGLAAGAFQQGGVGVLLALLILAVGHGINFLLGLMGGVVHGLRLNCIEFFNWSLTEEGQAFQPFARKSET